MLSADAEHGEIFRFSPPRFIATADLPFIPPPLLFRTIRASWSDNDCLVIAGGQAVDILYGSCPKSPPKMASRRLWMGELWRDVDREIAGMPSVGNGEGGEEAAVIQTDSFSSCFETLPCR